MASPSATDQSPNNKTVTGYPASPHQIATGYPASTAAAATSFRPVPVHTSYTQHQQQPIRPTLLLHRLFLFFIAVLSLMSLLLLTTYLIFKPHLPAFQLNSAAVSRLNNVTLSQLTASWNFTLLVDNPNLKLTIYYDKLKASVFYGGELELAMTQLQPFCQERNNESRIEFQLGIVNDYVGDDVANKIVKEKNNGSVDFGIRVFAWVRFSSGVWRMREHLLRVYCDHIRIGFSTNSNGFVNFSDQPKKCEVYL